MAFSPCCVGLVALFTGAAPLALGDTISAAMASDKSCEDKAACLSMLQTMAGNEAVSKTHEEGSFSVPDLPYDFDSLEPAIDQRTMHFHHDKHHAAYVKGINAATVGQAPAQILDLMENALEKVAVRNSGGGHYNHAFFWDEMASPDRASATQASDQLNELITSSFGSMDGMKSLLEAEAARLFGSGWVWLCVNNAGDKLEIVATPNQDNPLMKGVSSEIMFPILGVDVWEHAYYLGYQNVRASYVTNWWSVVDWEKVSENCAYAVEKRSGVPVRDGVVKGLADGSTLLEEVAAKDAAEGTAPARRATKGALGSDMPTISSGGGFANAPAARAASAPFTLPDLPYSFDALEPYVDEVTMKLHHGKHHAAYVAGLNGAVAGRVPAPLLDLLAKALEDVKAVRNHGGGHYNHAFFWDIMAPEDEKTRTRLSPELQEMIDSSFGSVEEMKAEMEAKAMSVFGSGWAWLCVGAAGDKLSIQTTPNQDNPLMEGVLSEVMFPILGVDVWEHAYYLKHQNLRAAYLKDWWHVVNWDKVSENYAYAVENKAGVPVRDGWAGL